MAEVEKRYTEQEVSELLKELNEKIVKLSKNDLEFRTLKANEIDVRIASINQNGFSVLLYKDARCDMNILDETVGKFNWKRTHSRDNANCTVELWDAVKEQWVSKEDTGKESYTEKEKGLASDSFKRACFNWGIGRELYTAPFIWIRGKKEEVSKQDNGRYTTKTKLSVVEIGYNENREINKLKLVDNKGEIRFTLGIDNDLQKLINDIDLLLTDKDDVRQKVLEHYKVSKLEDLTTEQATQAKSKLLKGNN